MYLQTCILPTESPNVRLELLEQTIYIIYILQEIVSIKSALINFNNNKLSQRSQIFEKGNNTCHSCHHNAWNGHALQEKFVPIYVKLKCFSF